MADDSIGEHRQLATGGRFRISLRFKLLMLAVLGLSAAASIVLLSLSRLNASVEDAARGMASHVATSLALQIEQASQGEAGEAREIPVAAAQRLIDFVHTREDRDIELIDHQLRIIADADHADIGKRITDKTMAAIFTATLADGKGRNFIEPAEGAKGARKQVVVPVSTAPGAAPLAVLVLEYTPILDEMNAAAKAEQQKLLLAAAPVALLMLIAILWIANRISKQVQRLHAATVNLSHGQYIHPIGRYSHDELGELAQAFDHMVESLISSENALRAEVSERRLAQEQVQAINATLEERVLDRTAKLTETNQRLDEELEERRAMERQLIQLACFDPLTGLPNRSHFLQRLEQAILRGQRTGKQVGLMFVDLDRFKSINDSLGHEVGDRVLQEVAQRMRSLLRQSDTVSRIGGDEFTIIIEDVDDPQSITHLAQKLIDGFAAPLPVGNTELFVTLSLGIAIYPDDNADIGELMKQADFAMYHAKSEGRNGYQCHSAQMGAAARTRLAIEHALRHALDRNEFQLYYQVRVSSKSNRPVGMEALLRWTSPDLGTVAPDDFIPIAEDTGLILELGDWVLRTACAQYARWSADGMRPGILGINVSARQFKQTHFVAQVARITREAGVDPANIELEVTESMLMSDPERASQQMTELRALGFGIAIDDFGTGYSSLSHLKRFPATKIKIDRAFVNGIDIKGEDAAIASAIVAMATSLNMQVTAEGVETPAQLARLGELACNEYQGFLFSEALPAQSMAKILQRGLLQTADAKALQAGIPDA